MSTQQFTGEPAVAAWAAQVRALRSEHGDDVTLPSIPIAGPVWAIEAEQMISVNDWPIIKIWHYGEWVVRDRVSARLEQFQKIAVDKLPDDYNIGPDGTILDSYVPQLGEIHGVETRVNVCWVNGLGRTHIYDFDFESTGPLHEALATLIEVSR